jgi:hypothetical protein
MEKATSKRAAPSGKDLAFEAGGVVGIEIIDKGRVCRLEVQLGALTCEPIFFLRVVVRAIPLDSRGPGLYFFGCLGSAVAIEPVDDFVIGGARTQELFNFVVLYSFELEEHLVERTGVVVFAGGTFNRGSAFINHACHQRVAGEPIAGASRRFFREIFRGSHNYISIGRH